MSKSANTLQKFAGARFATKVMSVLLRKKVNIRGKEDEIKVFHPMSSLSQGDRKRAEKLDAFLAEKVPALAEKIMRLSEEAPLRRGYLLGKELRRIVDNNDLVLRSDVHNNLIWEAIKQHLPETIGWKGAGQAYDSNAPQHQDRGHLPTCYAISSYPWEDVKWLHRWNDWFMIHCRGSMWKDPRILASLQMEITRMEKYPKRDAFRKIIKNLAAQTTGKHIKILPDSVISEKVHTAIEKAELDAA